ncbi:MAG: efflux RND transporter permease subunit [Methylococcaceae bacterium]
MYRFYHLILNSPRLTILAVMLVVFGVASGAANLWQTIDYKVYYSKTDPLRIALDDLESTFTKLNNAFIIVAPKDGDVFTEETLNVIHEITNEAWQVPYSNRVSSITNYQHTYVEQDDLTVKSILEEPQVIPQNEIVAARDILLAEETLVGRLISDKGHVTAIDVALSLPDNPVNETREVTDYVRDMLAPIKKNNPDIEFYLTGSAFADEVLAIAAERDLALLIPISYAIIIALLILLLRSISATLVTLSVITLSIVFAFGVKGFYNGAITPITLLTPFMIMTIAVADCVHLFVSIFQFERYGMSKRQAAAEALRVNIQPIFLTSLTTAVGFLCLNFSESPALNDLGNVVAFGVSAAFALTITLVPALYMLFSIRTPKRVLYATGLLNSLAKIVIGNPRRCLILMVVAGGVLAVGLPRNEINEIFIDFFDDSFDFRVSNEFYDNNLSGFHRAEYSIGSADAGGVNQPEYLGNLESFGRWLRKQPQVAHVYIYTDTIKRLNQTMHNDDAAFYRIPSNREEAAQYSLLYETQLPYGFNLGDRVSHDKSKTRVTVKLWLTDSENILKFNQSAMTWLEKNTPEYMHSKGVGVDIMFSKTARNNVSAMYYGTFAALAAISLILVVSLRSVTIGITSLIPNLLPAIMAFGLWGLLYGRIGLSESVVASLTLGLVVDDTVHFLNKYLRGRREQGLNAEEAVQHAFKTVGVALMVTTTVFAMGFGILSFSHYSFNSHMGALTAITITFALLIDFILLPALLVIFDIGSVHETPLDKNVPA